MKILGLDIKLNVTDKKVTPETTETQELKREIISDVSRELIENAPKKKDPTEKDYELPVAGGRSSAPDTVSLLQVLMADYMQVNPEFQIELLKALEHLGMYNDTVSYAIDNIVQLGNTDYTVAFDDSISDQQAKEMKALLAARSSHWYAGATDINSLVNDLLAQAAIAGVISSEIVPREDLTGVKKAVLVAPKNIRFVYDPKTDEHLPHQVVNGQFNLTNVGGLRPLNPVTYKYHTLRKFNENPYGIPPFLAALEGISIGRDMACNFGTIMKKVGALGFLQVLVTQPTKLPTETNLAYEARASAYLESLSPTVSKSLGKGFVLGYKGSHEFKMENGGTANAAGTKDLYELNNQSTMAGLKQDPLLFGRNYNTSETLGRVILTKMTGQVVNYQRLVAGFLRELFLMELRLAGYTVPGMTVTFARPLLGDQAKEEEARGKKIDNVIKLRNEGIISQQDAAEELGYEKPAEDGPILPAVDPANPSPTPDPAGTKRTDPANNIREAIAGYEADLFIHLPEFEYNTEGCSCSDHSRSLSFSMDSDDERYIRRYLADIRSQYRKSSSKIAKLVGQELVQLGSGATLEQVSDKIIYILYKNWKIQFSKPSQKIIKQYVKEAYVFFRKSNAAFPSGTAVPEATFGVVDTRTISYYAGSDELYLGKFITDSDTRKALTKFIKEEYVAGNMPLGDEKGLAKFVEKFGSLFKGEEWKLERIIATTVNRLRNSASVAYMQQAEVEEFEIVGVNDRLQCDYCKTLQGKRFSVTKAFDTVSEQSKSDPESVKFVTPFITSLYKKAEDLAGVTEADLQAKGIGTPPFHSNCRDTVVAIL